MKKAFVFTMDDNIRFLQELTKSDMQNKKMDALWIMLKNVMVFVALAIPGFLLVKTKELAQAQGC